VTALDIIKGSLLDLGVLATGETPSPSEGDEALTSLNELVDAKGAERLAMFTVLRTVKVLASGTASYTIGSGGSINIVRPTYVDKATIVQDNTATTPNEVEIRVLDADEWACWPTKNLQSSQSQAIYFDHGWSAGLGLIYPLPIPDNAATSLVLYTPAAPAAQFADLNTTSYTFPPAVRRMLRKLLAIELQPQYPGSTISPALARAAQEANMQFKAANVRPLTHTYDAALGGFGHWNIETDAYNRRGQ